MAFDTAYPQILANLAAGNEPVAIIDSNFTPIYNGILSLNTFGNYYVDSGAANAYVVTLTARQAATLAAGLPVQLKAANANTGASTLNVNGTGALAIKTPGGSALSAGQIPANAIVSVMYDGTSYQLLSGGSIIALATPVASTSGTSIDFTGLPAKVKRITVMLNGVSTNGTTGLLIQLGDSGGIENAGYLSSGIGLASGAAVGGAGSTAGFIIPTTSAAHMLYGAVTLNLENAAGFAWVASGIVTESTTPATYLTSGRKATSAELDRVRVTSVNGTDVFDAGEINISYEVSG